MVNVKNLDFLLEMVMSVIPGTGEAKIGRLGGNLVSMATLEK
jgi:hypothetical protein